MSAQEALRGGLLLMRSAAPGPVALARLLWHAQRAESALARDRFEECWDQLWRVGQVMSPHTPSALAWEELVVTMLEVCLRGALKPQLAETLEQYGWLAWPAEGEAPWSALGLIAACEEAGTWSTGAHLGDLLSRQWPACAAGPLMAGHMRELELLASGELSGPRLRAAAQRMERALELCEARPALIPRVTLRAGVALMLEGQQRSRGRALLRSLDASKLGPQARRWYALGMARSDFWLDRVRAADIIDELAEQTPVSDHRGRAELAALLRSLLSQETLAMTPAEEDRLGALINALAEHGERGKLRDLMELKRLMTEHGGEPAAQAAAITAQLAHMSAHYEGPWQTLAATYRGLSQLSAPEPDLAALLAPTRAASGAPQIALLAQEILYASVTGGVPGTIGALQYALGALDGKINAIRTAELRPLSAIWPRLLAHLDTKPADEAASEQQAHLRTLITRLFGLWAERAPAPAQGWWLLSAHLARAGLMEAATQAAERAHGAGEQGDPTARGSASGRILAWVISEGEPARMLRWLERADPGEV